MDVAVSVVEKSTIQVEVGEGVYGPMIMVPSLKGVLLIKRSIVVLNTGEEKSINGASKSDVVSGILGRLTLLISILPARLDVGLGFRVLRVSHHLVFFLARPESLLDLLPQQLTRIRCSRSYRR